MPAKTHVRDFAKDKLMLRWFVNEFSVIVKLAFARDDQLGIVPLPNGIKQMNDRDMTKLSARLSLPKFKLVLAFRPATHRRLHLSFSQVGTPIACESPSLTIEESRT